MGKIIKNGIPYTGGGSGGGGGSSDYTELTNKPTLNGVTLAKGQTTGDLGLEDDETIKVNANGKLYAVSPTISGNTLIFP